MSRSPWPSRVLTLPRSPCVIALVCGHGCVLTRRHSPRREGIVFCCVVLLDPMLRRDHPFAIFIFYVHVYLFTVYDSFCCSPCQLSCSRHPLRCGGIDFAVWWYPASHVLHPHVPWCVRTFYFLQLAPTSCGVQLCCAGTKKSSMSCV